jgi:class 3 adenylate cyclase/tetratricopeptide (TPR) repeat protein
LNKIVHLLTDLGLEKYSSIFDEAEIEFGDLPDLSDADFIVLGLPMGPRRRLARAIKALSPERESAPGAPTDAAPTTTAPKSAAHAERRHLTVMFVDLVGSTEMTARLDPEDARTVITAYQNAVAGVVTRFEGFVARYMGDGVLCYFGWPRANEDDAERAIRAGQEIIDVVKRMTDTDDRPLATRIGIASGVVIVGDLIGSGASEEAAVVGETPNLAARLQGLAQPNQLVLPSATRALLGGLFELQLLGKQQLKGIAEPVEAYCLLGEAARESRFDARQSGVISPIVGRQQELDLISERWARAKAGSGQMVVVSGEAGIGKSRITRAAIDIVKADVHVRATFQCSPYHSENAFYPVIQFLSAAIGSLPAETDQERFDKLVDFNGDNLDGAIFIAPMLGIDTTGIHPPLELLPAQIRAGRMKALVQMLLRQAADKPLLTVFEDLHWVDPTTLELLDTMLDLIVDQPILVLATARPGFDHVFGGHPIVTRLSLNRLSKEQIAAIVLKLAGGKSVPQDVIEVIASRTDGVPLFVEELTKTILESNVLKENEEGFILAGPLNALAIPNTLHDSLMARLDRLHQIKEVAQTAACIGREFNHELLSSISPWPQAELDTALEGLIKAELIYRRGIPPAATYLFKHALVRDAAYESLLKGERRTVHSKILAGLEGAQDGAAEVLAHHAVAAGQIECAISYLHDAGAGALRLGANAEAVAHLSKGLTILRTLPEGPDRDDRELNLLMTRGPGIIAVKGYAADDIEPAYQRALALSESLQNRKAQFLILMGLALFYYVRADLRVLKEIAAKVRDLAKTSDQVGMDLIAERLFGYAFANSGELDAARASFDRVIESYDIQLHGHYAPQSGGSDMGVASLMYGGWVISMLGYLDQANARYAMALELANQLGHTISIVFSHWVAGIIHLIRNEPAAALECAQKVQAIAEEKEMPQYLAWSTLTQGAAYCLQGNYPKAIDNIQKGLADSEKIGSKLINPFWMSFLAKALGCDDRIDSGLGVIEDALDQIEQSDDRLAEAELHRLRGELLLNKDTANEPEAEASFLKAIDISQAQNAKIWGLHASVSLARLWCRQNRSDDARALLTPICSWFTEGIETPDVKAAKSMLAELQ